MYTRYINLIYMYIRCIRRLITCLYINLIYIFILIFYTSYIGKNNFVSIKGLVNGQFTVNDTIIIGAEISSVKEVLCVFVGSELV